MSLKLHLAIHVVTALLAGAAVWRIWKKPLASFAGGLLGGVLIDLDHFFDYFLTFGFHFKLAYFTRGAQFLKSDRILVLFHAWEYVPILIAVALVLRNRIAKSFFLALALGAFVHLCSDVRIDGMPVRSYSIIYRVEKHFDLGSLVTPDHYSEHLKEKLEATFD